MNRILLSALTGMLFFACEISNKEGSVSNTHSFDNHSELQNEDNSENQNNTFDVLNQDSLI